MGEPGILLILGTRRSAWRVGATILRRLAGDIFSALAAHRLYRFRGYYASEMQNERTPATAEQLEHARVLRITYTPDMAADVTVIPRIRGTQSYDPGDAERAQPRGESASTRLLASAGVLKTCQLDLFVAEWHGKDFIPFGFVLWVRGCASACSSAPAFVCVL